MFRNVYQSSLLTILYSCGASPLELWGMEVKNGFIRRVTDEEVKSLALEIAGTNVATTYIYAPKDTKTVLAINLPFLIMVIKNMKKYFTFEITILDDKRMHRRFRISNFQCTTKVRPFYTSMPIGLEGGWNQIQFNLADFTRRAYGSNYIETTRMQIHANCRIRRIYFADRLYAEDELPADYKLFLPEHTEPRSREISGQMQRTSGRSQPKISLGAVPAEEPPAFRVDSESIGDEKARRTTPVPSIEASGTIVAPDGASKVQIKIEAPEFEDEASIERETESELEEPTGEYEDTGEEMILEERKADISRVMEEERENEEGGEAYEENEEEERKVKEEREEERGERNITDTEGEDENEDSSELRG